MAERNSKAAVAAVGITAGALLALLASRPKPAQAAPAETGGVVSLDETAMQALISILQRAENLEAGVDEAVAAINAVGAALGVDVPLRLENPPDITAFRVLTTALTTPVQLPNREIPYRMELVVKAVHTNTGVIMVGPTLAQARNLNSSYWLIANEAVEYEIKNADHVWICPHPTLGIVGDGVLCTVEQEASK